MFRQNPRMRKSGKVVRWDDSRGFGFIRGDGKGQDVFLHVRDFLGSQGQAPRMGMAVSFDEVHVGGKGPRAVGVKQVGAEAVVRMDRPRYKRQYDAAPGSGIGVAIPLMVVYAAALAYAVWSRYLPWWVLPASLGVNLLAFYSYWLDKYAASKRQWRISEQSLHLLGLAGGWGGAWFAQRVLRHKTVKEEFQSTYWLTVVVHVGALGGLIWWRSG